MVGLLVMPPAMIKEVLFNRWPFGGALCDIWHAIDVCSSTASILNLLGIAFDRCAPFPHVPSGPPRPVPHSRAKPRPVSSPVPLNSTCTTRHYTSSSSLFLPIAIPSDARLGKSIAAPQEYY